MQIALDDFRARVRAGRAETARAVERAARAPEAFRTIVRREITESSESSSSESTSGGVGNAFERTAQAERRQQTGREGSGEDTEEEGFLQRVEPVEGADTSGNRRKEREVPRRELRASEQELEGSAGGLNSDPKVAGRLSIGISKQPEVQKAEETFVQVEEERKGLAGDTGKVQEEESRPEGEAETPNEGKAPVSQTGAENMETREKGTPGVSKSATAKEEPPRSGQMVTPEKVHMEKVPTQSQQEGRVAEASSGGGEEVQSPASVKTRQGGGKDWTDDLLGMDGGLAPVKTVVTNGRDSMPDDVKSPDTVKVLVRRKENPLARESLEADVSLEREPGDKAESAAASEKEPGDPLFGSSGPMEAAEADQRRADLPLSTFGQALEPPVQFFPVKRDVEGADANKQVPLGGAVPLGGVVPLGGSVPLGGVVPLGGLVPLGGSVPPGRKEKAGGSAQRRRSGGGVTILEEVAKLAEREAPNAESRTTTPRDATNPRPPVENIDGPPKSDGFEAREVEGRLGELQKKAGVDAASKGARGRQAGERDDGDVQSETGSVSPVEVTHRGVPAWPSVVETGHRIKKASEGGQADQMSASGEDFVAGTVESAVFQVGHPDKVPDQSVSAERRPVDYAKVTARTGQVEPVGFTVDQFGLHEATAVAAATEQPAPLDPEDMPKVEEGTAIEPVKVSIWEKLQETVRESVPESVRESVLEGDPKQQAAGSVVASLAAEEVAEELDIDYDDAAYSEGGLSNLSIPAADG